MRARTAPNMPARAVSTGKKLQFYHWEETGGFHYLLHEETPIVWVSFYTQIFADVAILDFAHGFYHRDCP